MTSPDRPLRMIANPEAIGCDLAADEMDTRIDEKHRLAHAAVTRDRSEDVVRITFASVDRRALADLVEREHECCAFLSFSAVLTPTGTTLEIRARADAGEVPSAFF